MLAGPARRGLLVALPLLLLGNGAGPAAGRVEPGQPGGPSPHGVQTAQRQEAQRWVNGVNGANETDGGSDRDRTPSAAEAGLAAAPATGSWPLAPRPRVVAHFVAPQARWSAGHRGVDLAGVPGQPVLAARDGVVRHAGRLAGRGVVSVEHADGTRTTYEPLLVDVARGDVLRAGERLGWLVTAGSHCAPATCLHWGWRRDDDYLDPLALVGARPVRLLPLDGPPVTAGVGHSAAPSRAQARVPHPWAASRPGTTGGPAGAQARGWAWR